MRVFLVENHPDTLACVSRFLKRAGHDVVTAHTASETLSALPALDCDVLLADLGLPDGDGWTLLEQLGSARPRWAIAMSGRSTPSDRARSKAAGFQEHLVKPFLPDDLERALKQAEAPDQAAS